MISSNSLKIPLHAALKMMDHLEEEKMRGKMELLRPELSALMRRNEMPSKCKRELRSELGDLKQSKDLTSDMAELKELREFENYMEARLLEDDVSVLKSELEQSRQLARALQQTITQLQLRLSHLRQINENLTKSENELRSELKQMSAQRDDLISQVEELKKQREFDIAETSLLGEEVAEYILTNHGNLLRVCEKPPGSSKPITCVLHNPNQQFNSRQ